MTSKAGAPRRQVRALVGQGLLFHFAYFALLPFLPVVLSEDYGISAGVVGVTLFLYNFVGRAGSVLVGEIIERMSQRLAAVSGLLIAAVGVLALAAVTEPVAVVALLCVVAFGGSVSSVVMRALLARAAGDGDRRTRAFAHLSVAVNVAAGAAPLVTGVLTDWGPPSLVFLVSGGTYLLAAVTLAAFVRSDGDRARPGAGTAPVRLAPYLALVRDPRYRRLLGASVLFWFFYAQQYAALPLYLDATTGSRGVVGSFYAVGSGLAIFLQVPVTALVLRLAGGRTRRPLFAVFPWGLGCFALAFALLAAGAPLLPAVYLAAGVLALGVMVVVPVMDTLYADLAPADRQVTAFNARKLTWAVGESCGAFVGVTVQLRLAAVLEVQGYWWALALCALATGLLLGPSARRRASEGDRQPPPGRKASRS